MEEKVKLWKKQLCQTLALIDNEEDVDLLLQDLCTYNEIVQMAQRLNAAKMFLQGKTYAQIIDKTEISSATLSRISRCIQHGSGGYNKVLRIKMKDIE